MQQLVILLLINCSSTCFGRLYAWNMLRNYWLTIKSLIVASSWSHLYLLIKDARSFEHKVLHSLCSLTSPFYDEKSEGSFLSNFPHFRRSMEGSCFRPSAFWWEQHVDANEFGTLVEWYWQGETEVLGQKQSLSKGHILLQILTWTGVGSKPVLRFEAPASNHLSHGKALK